MPAITSFINETLDTMFTGTFTLHLYSVGTPSTTGVEISGGGYTSQTLAFAAAANKIKATSANVVFTDLPTSTTIVAYGIKKSGVLKDEGTIASFTPDVTNNTLEITYQMDMSGV